MIHRSAPAIKGTGGHHVHQGYVARHALLQAVILENCGARVTAQFFSQFAVAEQISHAFGQRLVIKEIHQQTVVAVLNHLLHGGSGGAHDGALGAHRFQQAPAQHKRIGEVYMRLAELQQVQEIAVGQGAGEVHTAGVVVAFDFG